MDDLITNNLPAVVSPITIGTLISSMDTKTILIFLSVFMLLTICLWILFKFIGGLLFKKISKWISDRNISLNSGKIVIPGIGDIGFSSNSAKTSAKQDIIADTDEHTDQEDYLRKVTNFKGDLIIFIGVLEDRIHKITEKQNKKTEVLMKHYESLEQSMILKISDKLSIWLNSKLLIPKDDVYDNDQYNYIISIFENILNRIKIEWRSSFIKNGFEDVAEEEEYVTEKSAILKAISKNYLQRNFKNSKILKSDLFGFLDDLEPDFRKMNISLFERARRESKISDNEVRICENDIKKSKDVLLKNAIVENKNDNTENNN